jgi:hypothetical protein
MKSCIILLSHANNKEKEKILNECILSLKDLNLPIILVSHAPISERNQQLCDYSLYEKNNILFKETDFFEYELPLTESNFNVQYFFGGISTRTYLQKKTYNGSVLNLVTNGINIANSLGFDYGLFWEFDFILQEKSKEFLKSLLHDIETKNYDCFYIPCAISGIKTTYSIPQIFPIKKLVEYNSKLITNTKEFIEVTKFQICEEWLYNFYKTLSNPLSIPFDEYFLHFPDMVDNLSSSDSSNPLFNGLNSGIFIDKNDKTNWIFSVYNDTSFTIKYTCNLIFDGNEIQTYMNDVYPNSWYYNAIPKDIINEILNYDKFLEVYEIISYNDVTEIFQYKINKDNLESISKAKVFFYL